DLPHDHRGGAHQALGHPALAVLVEPVGEPLGAAEVAVVGHRPCLPVPQVGRPRQPRSRRSRNARTASPTASGPPPSSSRRTNAEPTTTPSAPASHTSTACSG